MQQIGAKHDEPNQAACLATAFRDGPAVCDAWRSCRSACRHDGPRSAFTETNPPPAPVGLAVSPLPRLIRYPLGIPVALVAHLSNTAPGDLSRIITSQKTLP